MIQPPPAITPKQNYITDGLIAWYDASNNQNGTHDLDSTVWKDISGNENHIDFTEPFGSANPSSEKIAWTNSSLIIQEGGGYIKFPSDVTENFWGNNYTIEIVTSNLSYDDSVPYFKLFQSDNDELAAYVRVDENMKLWLKNNDSNGDSFRPTIYDSWDYINNKTLAFTSDLTAFDGIQDINTNPNQPGNVHIYSNGVQIAKGESRLDMYIGDLALGDPNWSGSIHSIRIYNRTLTQEELEINAIADQFYYRSTIDSNSAQN